MKLVKEWYLKEKNAFYTNAIIYTYWFNFVTSCFALYFNSTCTVISRVHGIDLYEERNNNYFPLRRLSIKNLRAVYCISLAGVNYLKKRYPQQADKYKLSRIGVKPTLEYVNIIRVRDNIFRIISCSAIIPLKRVDLILKGVIKFANMMPDRNVEYIHFGEGPLKEAVLSIVEKNKKANLKVLFLGNVPNNEILSYYRDNVIDVFINASTTEGLPVSIMEAQSFGIPCIGTNVGGIPEIINCNNGLLLSENPSVSEIADALMKIYSLSHDEMMEMRKNSFENWKKNFDADVNFKKFAEDLQAL